MSTLVTPGSWLHLVLVTPERCCHCPSCADLPGTGRQTLEGRITARVTEMPTGTDWTGQAPAALSARVITRQAPFWLHVTRPQSDRRNRSRKTDRAGVTSKDYSVRTGLSFLQLHSIDGDKHFICWLLRPLCLINRKDRDWGFYKQAFVPLSSGC